MKTEVWKSKQTLKIFPYDPAVDYANVVIKKDKDDNFVSAVITDPTGRTKPLFIEPGERVCSHVGKDDIIYLMADPEYDAFRKSDSYELVKEAKEKPGSGTGGN